MYAGERFNGYSHLAGFVFTAVAAAFLIGSMAEAGNWAHIAGALAFCVCAMLLYAASTLYHSTRGRAKRFWQRADHCAIYLMVAGSFTPFALVAARYPWDWAVLAVVWGLALYGIVREVRARPGAAPPLALYVATGWLGVAGTLLLAARLDAEGLAWLVAGAVAYTAGTTFYRNRSGWRHAHGAWHSFVMCGTACHFVAVASLYG